MGKRMKSWMILAIAVLCGASMWSYTSLILVARQEREAALYGTPRGNLSDLYPVWLGARALLLDQKNPYGQEVTREIQAGYYGRALDPLRHQDPTNQQAFVYPVYVAFLVAPTIKLPFAEVQAFFRWLLAFVTATSVLAWLRFLGWRPNRSMSATFVLLTLGTFAAVQGIRLEQLSLLVAALIAAAMALLSSGHMVPSGILLALAMIKPQLALPLAAWLLLWSLGDFRARARFDVSFLVSTAALVLGGEYLLPGWIAKFREASRAYLHYAAGGSLLEEMLTRRAGIVFACLIVIALAFLCWPRRHLSAGDPGFRATACLVLATTVIIIPMFPPHYQLLLLPGGLLLLRESGELWAQGVVARALLLLAAGFLFWQWASAAVLVAASWLGMNLEGLWHLPLWTSVLLPIPLAACLVLETRRIIQPRKLATDH
jgi:hypothetical protein